MVFFFLLAFTLSAKKLYISFFNPEANQKIFSKETQKIKREALLCKKILNGRPLGVVKERSRLGKRLYLYWENDQKQNLIHNWYHEGKLILKFECSDNDEICISSISPYLAKQGGWSVDIINGKYLIDSKQFELTK